MKEKKISITTYSVERLAIDAKIVFKKVIDQNDLMPESSESTEIDTNEETSTDEDIQEPGDAKSGKF